MAVNIAVYLSILVLIYSVRVAVKERPDLIRSSIRFTVILSKDDLGCKVVNYSVVCG